MEAGSDLIQAHPENCTGCLRCQLRCSWTYASVFSPLEAYIQIEPGEVIGISFTEDCNGCGYCVEECLFGALELR